MTERPPLTPEQLDAYLDDQLDPQTRAELEQRLAEDPAAQQRLAEAMQVDHRLRAQFAPPAVTTEQIESWLAEPTDACPPEAAIPLSPTGVQPRTLRWRIVLWGMATAALLLIAFSLWQRQPGVAPFFKPQALAAIYEETVTSGFRPYYFCEDPQRFAGTFEKRQGIALQLQQTPTDRMMVGLSYLGGLSRETTAMLCRVEDKPVIVFVDRAVHANAAITATEPGLFVHRAELGDLILFEVGPFETPQMIDYLKLPD